MWFEFLGFLVKCAEPGWLLEVSFHAIFSSSSYFGKGNCYLGCPKSSIWQAWWLHFRTLGPRGNIGGPCEQQNEHVGVRNQFLSDFEMAWRPYFETFFSSDGLNPVFCSGFVPFFVCIVFVYRDPDSERS